MAPRFVEWLWILARRLLGVLLLLGRRPRHVAFIMDGNRRFADNRHMDKIGGHKHGYGKMVDVIHWCLEVGVECISVYAFSIDNFQRSPDEVGSLMRLAEEKYGELAQEHGLAEKERIKIQVLGDLSLAPSSVQGAAARMMQATAKLHKCRAVLNICFSYTATEEIVQAVDAIQEAVRTGQLEPSDVSPGLLDRCLRTGSCPPVDLVIRTSGETRLSDFLLWQSRGAQLEFVEKLWPDFSFLDFARCVLRFQRGAAVQQALRTPCAEAARSSGAAASADQAPASPRQDAATPGASQAAPGSDGGRGPALSIVSPSCSSGAVPHVKAQLASALVQAWALLAWLCSALHAACGGSLWQPAPKPRCEAQAEAACQKACDSDSQPGCQRSQQDVMLGAVAGGARVAEFLKRRDDICVAWIEAHAGCA